ncbi:3-hydroxyacyl-ACP dehydratase FabZ family protein [Gimesia aquarii]|uniref:3-hydroxyacyl-[acyl-carrier-protein] dehydratase FabZ n=1 Tax=Gimesia aquarii TaxID=2527964 RepID=A0A517VUV0_9PLAN|nr:3-hydroxyacyl-ACP dehydratase FabZ family protein [Gimesia aquarii]QDT96785.1 3-hydroxyacyl-[acyl-carrier-protein] dehydratase FabZ [Gimesia aquarii]
MNLDDIKACIPHREPFLWLDEIVSLEENGIHARKLVSPDSDFFQGHYPDNPILPGVFLCEAAMQASAVFIAKLGVETGDKVPVATRLNNTKFRRMVKPGETLDIHVNLKERLGAAYFFTGKIMVGGETAARLEFAVTATDK